MTNAGTPDQDAVRYWKLAASATEPFQNRWAIQLRLPIVAANQPITAGIERGSRFWYQATAQLSGGGGGPYATVGWFPRELTTPICPMTSLADFLIHEELGSVDATNCPLCSPDKFSNLSTSGAIAAACDGGISIDYDNVGAVFNPTAGTDFSMVSPTNQFKAVTVTGVAAPNVVVAQPRNTTNAAISAPLMARFRLAAWGSAPWSNPADTGQWKDMRGAEGGVCGAGTAPNCTNIVIPASTSPSGGRAAITFPWQIGTGPLNASEYCLYGLTPPAATNTACSAPGTAGCASGEVRATGTGGTFPCVSPIYQYDQCMLVELSAPNGTANFVKQSTWNNMTFSQLSVMSREALIDARTLPKGPKQQYQDIYLIAMARNMPVKLPVPVSDGSQYIRQLAFDRAQEISKTYAEDFAKLAPEQLKLILDKLQRQIPSPNHDPSPFEKKLGEPYRRVQLARVIAPQRDYDRIGGLLEIATKQGTAAELTEAVVKTVGPSEAADVVPTLDIYPFYQHLGVGDVYMPMSSFTVFLSHEGSMIGMKWLIDGADKVGENIYHLRIPTGFARKIRVRAEAIEPASGALLTPQNPKWPCSGGCACGGGAKNCGLVSLLGNTAPGLVAGVFVVARRRKKPAKKSAQKSAEKSIDPS
jgi:hypothetical protein